MANFKVPEAEFLLSSPSYAQAPKRPLPEIAFAGRSNVGKSSLINSLLGRKGLAMISRTPGKTRLLNYFLIGRGLCYFVDLPGYGFARVSGEMQEQWGESIEGYLRDSTRLARVVLILDIRHGPTPLDEEMIDGLHILHRSWIAVLTKADKLGPNARAQAMARYHGALISRGARAVLPFSSLDNTGREALWAEIIDAVSPSVK